MKRLSDERPLTSDVDLLAMYKAASFIVQSYRHRGFDAYRVQRRLQMLMDRSRRAGLWTADQYRLAAEIYRDVIQQQYNVRVGFWMVAE